VPIPNPNRPPSIASRISKYVTRMQLFKQVFQHELLYTMFITILLLIIAVIMLVGVSSNFLLGPDGWIALDWMVVSFCTMQSFSRVVRRHEREAILSHPSAWDPMYRAELEAARAFHHGNPRRPLSPISVMSRQPLRRDDQSIAKDPFLDVRSTFSGYSYTGPSDPPLGSPSQPRGRRSKLARNLSLSASTSYEPSPAPSISDRMYRPATSHWDSAVVLPSPVCRDTPISPATHSEFSDTDSQHIIIMRPTTAPADVPSYHSYPSYPFNHSSPTRRSFDSRTRWEPPDRNDDGRTLDST